MLVQNLLSPFFPELIFRIPTNEKKIFLTFDDGPTPEITSWVLDELEKHHAHATFFCIGENVEKHPELFSEIIKQGHVVGNHTMRHLNGWRTKTKNYLGDVEECGSLLTSSQLQTNLFRPPYGRITQSQYSSLKKTHRIVLWDVLSRDYDSTISGETCLQRVITKSKSGSIVVFHDSRKAEKKLRHVLPKMLEHFSEKRYLFASLPN
jgi:peptidoglycan-N-acetylglucosamine deacetylase